MKNYSAYVTSKPQDGKCYILQEIFIGVDHIWHIHLQYVSFCQVIQRWTRKYHLTHTKESRFLPARWLLADSQSLPAGTVAPTGYMGTKPRFILCHVDLLQVAKQMKQTGEKGTHSARFKMGEGNRVSNGSPSWCHNSRQLTPNAWWKKSSPFPFLTEMKQIYGIQIYSGLPDG